MTSGFFATQCAVTEEEGVLITALGADPIAGQEQYLMLQHCDEYSEQDVELGMDRVHIEYCGQGWSWYGHIDRAELTRNQLRLQMSQAAAARMGNDGRIEVGFAIDDGLFESLRRALRRTFQDQSWYVELD
ncbi:Imm10 family immunity protein [Inhella sp.]|uniref:Imm10 family immunity protein n=1 Tax=Inhella sp. TaxID=1921806 RepID=UPI0035B13CF4